MEAEEIKLEQTEQEPDEQEQCEDGDEVTAKRKETDAIAEGKGQVHVSRKRCIHATSTVSQAETPARAQDGPSERTVRESAVDHREIGPHPSKKRDVYDWLCAQSVPSNIAQQWAAQGCPHQQAVQQLVQQPAMQTMQVTCPPSAGPGTPILIQYASGANAADLRVAPELRRQVADLEEKLGEEKRATELAQREAREDKDATKVSIQHA